MTKRKDDLERWLVKAMSTDKTRPNICEVFCRVQGGGIATSDGHRAHMLFETKVKKLYYKLEPIGNWVLPAQTVAVPPRTRCYEIEISCDTLKAIIQKKVNEQVLINFEARRTAIEERSKLFNNIQKTERRDNLMLALREAQDTLKASETLNIGIPINDITANPNKIVVNARYLNEAIITKQLRVKLVTFEPLDPVFLVYSETGQAVIMPQKH